MGTLLIRGTPVLVPWMSGICDDPGSTDAKQEHDKIKTYEDPQSKNRMIIWCGEVNVGKFSKCIEVPKSYWVSYCWWLKSCTTWDVWNPKNNGINYQPQLVNAGFQPSTVLKKSRILSESIHGGDPSGKRCPCKFNLEIGIEAGEVPWDPQQSSEGLPDVRSGLCKLLGPWG